MDSLETLLLCNLVCLFSPEQISAMISLLMKMFMSPSVSFYPYPQHQFQRNLPELAGSTVLPCLL